MTLGGNRTDRPEKAACWEYREEAQPDERGGLQRAGSEVGVVGLDGIVEANNLLSELRTDPAHEKITVWRHRSEKDRRPVLDPPVGLGKRRQNDVALIHRLRSAAVYSGSSPVCSRKGALRRGKPIPRRAFRC